MKKLIVIGLVVLFMGCQGKKGETGIRGPGHLETLTGVIVSDDFTITDSLLGKASSISVYLNVDGEFTEMPYFLPALGINAYYLFNPDDDALRIINAEEAQAQEYIIVLIIE